MKTARICFAKQTASDSRDTASDVGSIVVPQEIAVKYARYLDGNYEPALGNAVGHGDVKYESGRVISVSEYD